MTVVHARHGSGRAGQVVGVLRGGLLRRRRPLAAVVAVLSLLALAAGFAISENASAAYYTGGALTVGTTTTVTATSTNGLPDSWTYTIDVPANRRVTFTAGGTDSSGNIAASSNGRTLGSQPRFGTAAGREPFFDVDPSPTDRTLSVLVETAGTLSVTPALMDDLAPQPLAWATPTTATVATAGQQAVFTFQGVAGHRLGVSVSGSTFPATPRSFTASLQPQGQIAQQLTTTGPTLPGIAMTDVPYRLVVDGAGSATGSVTVRIDDVVDVTGSLTSGATQTADLSTVWTQVSQTYQQVPGGRLQVEVLSSTLRHTDGTPGRATIGHVSPSGYGPRLIALGTVGDQPVTLTPDLTMADNSTRTLQIVPDGRSTGTLTYRLTVTPPADGGVLAFDRPTTVTVPAPRTAVLLTVHVAANQRVALAASKASLSAATGTPGVVVGPFSGPLSAVGQGSLTLGDGGAGWVLLDGGAGGDCTVLVAPSGATTGSVTLLLHAVTAISLPLTPGTAATATVGVGDTLQFTAPAGQDLAPALTVASTVTGIDGSAQGIDLDVVQDGSSSRLATVLTGAPFGGVVTGTVDPTRPWQLAVGFPAIVGTSGTVTVTLAAPTVTTGALGSGRARTLAFPAPGTAYRLTLPTAPGKRLAVRALAGDGVHPRVRVTDAAGTVIGRWDDTVYTELDAPAVAGPVTVTVEDLATTPGSLTLTAWSTADPVVPVSGTRTVRWDVAQNPRLTFPGVAGRHAILDVSAASWTYGSGLSGPGFVPARVLGPDGAEIDTMVIPSGTASWLEVRGVLPATGTYSIVIDPDLDAAGSLTAALRQPADLTRTATLGRPVDVQVETPGQNAVVTVTVPDGTTLGWRIRNSRFTNAALTLTGPDGTQYGSTPVPPRAGSTPGQGSGVLGGPLPAGTYRVVVDAEGRSTGSAQLTLTAG